MLRTKRDSPQIVCGAVMLLLGLCFLWFERCAVLGQVPLFVSFYPFSSRGWIMNPWQAITAGGLSLAFGLSLVIDAVCLGGRPSRREERSLLPPWSLPLRLVLH